MSDDPFGESPIEESEPLKPDPGDEPASGLPWGALIALVGIAITVVFAVQNTDPVPVTFLWMDGEYPLALVILITAAVTVLLTWLVGVAYRRRRKRRRAEQQELKRYREST